MIDVDLSTSGLPSIAQLQIIVGSVTTIGLILAVLVATVALANKGVHVSIARGEAELCALNTYLLAGELLRLISRVN